jgi:hypothetical protein
MAHPLRDPPHADPCEQPRHGLIHIRSVHEPVCVEQCRVINPSRKFVDYSQLIKIVFECLKWNRLVEKMYLILDQNKF